MGFISFFETGKNVKMLKKILQEVAGDVTQAGGVTRDEDDSLSGDVTQDGGDEMPIFERMEVEGIERDGGGALDNARSVQDCQGSVDIHHLPKIESRDDRNRASVNSLMHDIEVYRLLQIYFFLKNGPTPASFSFIFGLFKQTSLQFLQQIYLEKISIQYTVPGFEPTTFGMCVSSLYH